MKESTQNTLNPKTNLENKIFEIKRRAFNLVRSSIENSYLKLKNTGGEEVFINNIIKEGVRIVPEATEEFHTKLNELKNYTEKDLEIILDKATEITIQLMAKYLSLEELESRFKARHENLGYQSLARGLTFETNKEGNEISLHVPITFFNNSLDALNSYIDGFHKLANELSTNDELKGIKEITAYSSIVKEKYKTLTKLGFEVMLDKHGQPTKKAKISKEKFLELYGK